MERKRSKLSFVSPKLLSFTSSIGPPSARMKGEFNKSDKLLIGILFAPSESKFIATCINE